jgi:hypothetical protein
MPFKSKAQRRKFAALLVEGKIKPETYEEWNRSTGAKVLPERIHPKPASRKTPKQAVRKRTRKPSKAKRATTRRSRMKR